MIFKFIFLWLLCFLLSAGILNTLAAPRIINILINPRNNRPSLTNRTIVILSCIIATFLLFFGLWATSGKL